MENGSTVWHNVSWWHMEQFKKLLGDGRSLSKKVVVIWFACVWCIWKSMNAKLFRNEEIRIEKIVEEAKLTS